MWEVLRKVHSSPACSEQERITSLQTSTIKGRKIHEVFYAMIPLLYTKNQDPARQQFVRKKLPTLVPHEYPLSTVPTDLQLPPLFRTKEQLKKKPAMQKTSTRRTNKRMRY